MCDSQEWIYWREDGELHPLYCIPVYCVQSGLVCGGMGCVRGCWRRTSHLALTAPHDSQRRTFITTVPPEGRQRLQGLSFWRGSTWKEALSRECLQGECDAAEREV